MAFPTINYKYNGMTEVQPLAAVVDVKFTSLEKFIADDESVTCDVEFEKVAPQQNGQVHRVEANVMVNGTLFRADATEDSFEKAIDEVRDELDKEMRRAKDKQVTMDKSAGREAKEQMLDASLETEDTV